MIMGISCEAFRLYRSVDYVWIRWHCGVVRLLRSECSESQIRVGRKENDLQSWF